MGCRPDNPGFGAAIRPTGGQKGWPEKISEFSSSLVWETAFERRSGGRLSAAVVLLLSQRSSWVRRRRRICPRKRSRKFRRKQGVSNRDFELFSPNIQDLPAIQLCGRFFKKLGHRNTTNPNVCTLLKSEMDQLNFLLPLRSLSTSESWFLLTDPTLIAYCKCRSYQENN